MERRTQRPEQHWTSGIGMNAWTVYAQQLKMEFIFMVVDGADGGICRLERHDKEGTCGT
ncbi:hypothetical protein KVP06_16435 [Geobacter sulfurreducens]|uniref:hypothetical protein n=1 Tax=Geobacter sulfurreducens TaxID=35554 RepID=UPI000022ECD2|nr:hypothetical protein [Geobacter sulfurreducens]UAC03927.1 hypothetical protein KVP06_16435 [Geobacter sulfurreducens]